MKCLIYWWQMRFWRLLKFSKLQTKCDPLFRTRCCQRSQKSYLQYPTSFLREVTQNTYCTWKTVYFRSIKCLVYWWQMRFSRFWKISKSQTKYDPLFGTRFCQRSQKSYLQYPTSVLREVTQNMYCTSKTIYFRSMKCLIH